MPDEGKASPRAAEKPEQTAAAADANAEFEAAWAKDRRETAQVKSPA